jgi:hypothetical protein
MMVDMGSSLTLEQCLAALTPQEVLQLTGWDVGRVLGSLRETLSLATGDQMLQAKVALQNLRGILVNGNTLGVYNLKIEQIDELEVVLG